RGSGGPGDPQAAVDDRPARLRLPGVVRRRDLVPGGGLPGEYRLGAGLYLRALCVPGVPADAPGDDLAALPAEPGGRRAGGRRPGHDGRRGAPPPGRPPPAGRLPAGGLVSRKTKKPTGVSSRGLSPPALTECRRASARASDATARR